ncbi:sensor domain-containing protein [Chloroflexota bacterium]
MIQSIEQYLSLLKKELSGCDRATIQDALSDTEGHLSMALNSTMSDGNIPASDALAQVIEKYGMPEEVAKAYREIENRMVPALSQVSHTDEPKKLTGKDERPFLRRFFGIFVDSRAWGAFLYLLFSLATGIIYFTWAVTGVSLSAGLMVLIIGLPFAGLFILSVRGISMVEGLIVEALLGIRMPRRLLFYRKNMGWWQNFKAIVSDKHTWLSLVYMILQLPLGIVYFTVFITLIALSLSGIAMPILQLGFDFPINIDGASYYLAGWMLALVVVASFLLATLMMHLAKYIGRMHGALAKALLVRS